jgi:hypothetical protein
MEFLNKGRWFYDPARGLLRTCKNPQQADSMLRKYWTKDRITATAGPSSDNENDEPVEPVADRKWLKTEKPHVKRAAKTVSKPEVKTTKSKVSKLIKSKGNKRGRKELIELSDYESSAEESDMVKDIDVSGSLPAKRNRCNVADLPLPLISPAKAEPEGTSHVASNGFPADAAITKPCAKLISEFNSTPSVHAATVPMHNPLSHITDVSGAMLTLLMSTAYDSGSVSIRQQELERRERECERKERQLQELADKERFMSKAVDAFKLFLQPR